jgi:hypothetical protein
MRAAIRAAAIGSMALFVAGMARTESPVFTLLYSAPQYIALLAVAVAASALPLLIVRPWGRTAQ